MSLAYGATATKNVRFRKSMEDAHKTILDFVNPGDGYFGVFDGHAGSMTAEWCAQRLHSVLQTNIKRYSSQWQMGAILAGTFDQVDRLLPQVDDFDNSGATAAIAYIKSSGNTNNGHRTLYTANVGDARIVLCNGGVAERLTKDHRPDDKEECRRIYKDGGHIVNGRVQGVLAVTRALGDKDFKKYVCGKPYTTETKLDDELDEFFIIGCDGLWDVCEDQEAIDLVRSVNDPKQASKILVRHAINKSSTDNITVMVVRLKKPPKTAPRAITTVSHSTKPTSAPGDEFAKRQLDHRIRVLNVDRQIPKATSPPADSLLAQLNLNSGTAQSAASASASANANATSNSSASASASASTNANTGHYRYGMRKKSVPCIFDSSNDSDAIQSD